MTKALILNDQSADHASPLHGIPILIKDNIATHDEMNNTGTGSLSDRISY
jgi:Asp-tRNA(Asn)/Glu-tRNA(Gln) amidotransferase A subunit family amidase